MNVSELSKSIDLDAMFARRTPSEFTDWVMRHHRDVTFEEARYCIYLLREAGKLELTPHWDLVRKPVDADRSES